MTEPPPTVPASEVRIGDRIGSHGLELTVTRIDSGFMGIDLLAFVEDSDEQWLKVPIPPQADVELLARASEGRTA